MRLLFCHGLEGTPTGRKVRALRDAGIDVLAPDFQGMNLAQRVDTLAALLAKLPDTPIVLAGSSYGGALAAWTVMQQPERFSGLLLLAPAVSYAEAPVPSSSAYIPPDNMPVIVIHGKGDTVVPASASIDYAARGAHVDLRLVDDGHRLGGSLPDIVAAAQELLE